MASQSIVDNECPIGGQRKQRNCNGDGIIQSEASPVVIDPRGCKSAGGLESLCLLEDSVLVGRKILWSMAYVLDVLRDRTPAIDGDSYLGLEYLALGAFDLQSVRNLPVSSGNAVCHPYLEEFRPPAQPLNDISLSNGSSQCTLGSRFDFPGVPAALDKLSQMSSTCPKNPSSHFTEPSRSTRPQ